MAWRVARSLDVLLAQLNALAPNRSKRSDGSVGDTSHQNRTSDHNPWYGPGIVTARDFTHDPANLNCQSLADRLVARRDPRIKYLIWNRRIWSPGAGWRNYTGPNPHTSHLHLSVVASPLCDDTRPWVGFTVPPVQPKPDEPPEENHMQLLLGRPTGSTEVWVGDGITRRHVADPTELEGLRYWIGQHNGDTEVHDIDDLRVLGQPTGANVEALLARPIADVDEAALAAELEARGFDGLTPTEFKQILFGAFNRAGQEGPTT